jgi:hypothetical protein
MSNVIPFRHRGIDPAARPTPHATHRGHAVSLRAEAGQVFVVLESVTLGMSPGEARNIGGDLVSLADHAEGRGQRVPDPGEPEARARLALLGRELDALDRGEKRLSDVVWLLRKLTTEVRR